MNYNEIRKTFLTYFEKHGHKIVPSASLIPNDPTLLFTVAGMVPWKGIIQGAEPAFAPRVADSQKCLRAGGKHNDLEDVGYDGSHHTFFEMLGNWSFGDYFKKEAIEMSWDLLTNGLGLDPARLVVTTHTSDEEATQLWKDLTGKDAIRLGDKSNWWSAGDTGPCGPCTEIFWDYGADVPGGLPGTPDEDGGRYVEIWNNVFMEFDRDANGKLTPLPNKNVDTGAGLERWAAVLQGKTDNYETDLFVALQNAVTDVTGVERTNDNKPSFKIIVDHLRAVGFAIADGIEPSNSDRGYVIRRILRRAMRHGQVLGHRGPLLSRLYPALIDQMGDAYPELITERDRVVATIEREENAFADMLENGMRLLNGELEKLHSLNSPISGENAQLPPPLGGAVAGTATGGGLFPGATAFKLYDTYGFPLDLTQMILRERGVDVDIAGFESAMKEQRERSRADTRGTKTLWESRTDLPATDDSEKYSVMNYSPLEGESAQQSCVGGGTILAILRNGEFVDSANPGDDVEVALDKTTFYGTRGGQVGDVGDLVKITDDDIKNERTKTPNMDVAETFHAGNVVVHKGKLNTELAVGDKVFTFIDPKMRQQTARAHTAAHLLQAALRRILGDGVEQRGSKVSPDAVRFDFSFPRPMTSDEIAATEKLINEWIAAKLPVTTVETDIKSAKNMGAMALFGEKYGDAVRVICVKNSDALSDVISASAGIHCAAGNENVSMELCGGTHITNTVDIKHAKINKEKSIASGIRRITMSVGDLA